ncbi:DUF2141 domain-containing protein [Paucibacter sp. XJ19-41]|uniref:DUF2141 domain-containing protein n=1 Tax=Paucibacter sp. XJ19-41 TaxID=2927824 RepID=UPI00234B3B54|nr:DUF2141 domain-containing protein [Paucibacter sp. XJ19-41]MDC6167160.1 DUF2141 domain-containing protein [Paucibacter sp. XJ19-41]
MHYELPVRRLSMLLLLALGTSVGAAEDESFKVEVEISHVRSAKGHLVVELCTAEQFLKPCLRVAKIEARAGVVHATFEKVPNGNWAMQAFHDEDDQGALQFNDQGIPIQGLAYSNNVVAYNAPPEFKAARFGVHGGNVRVSGRMHY